ncbi:MAG TPA: hypothetical protein VI036_15985 [Propionibacteriaceae bacterium]
MAVPDLPGQVLGQQAGSCPQGRSLAPPTLATDQHRRPWYGPPSVALRWQPGWLTRHQPH